MNGIPMDGEFKGKIQNLELRLGLLRELADSLAQAQAAVLRSDLGCLQELTSRQREVCTEYRQAVCTREPVLPATEPTSENASGAPEFADGKQRWLALRDEVARMETKTLELNRAYGALLRRARRTVDIFCRALASCSPTYGPPPQPAAPYAHWCREVDHV